QRPLSGLGEGLRGRRIRASGRYGKGVRIVAATVTDEAAPGAGGGHGGRATRKRLRARRREAGSMASAAATRAARARRVRAVGCSVAGAVPDEWIESTHPGIAAVAVDGRGWIRLCGCLALRTLGLGLGDARAD